MHDNVFSKLANVGLTEIINELKEARIYVRSTVQGQPGAIEMALSDGGEYGGCELSYII